MAETKLALVQTILADKSLRVRYANNPDSTHATEWLDFQVPLAVLRDPENPQLDLGNIETVLIGEVHLAALRYLRDTIGAEIQRFSGLRGRRG
jgi:hypothetical protein